MVSILFTRDGESVEGEEGYLLFPSLTVLSFLGGLSEFLGPGGESLLRGAAPVNHNSGRNLGPALTVAKHRELF